MCESKNEGNKIAEEDLQTTFAHLQNTLPKVLANIVIEYTQFSQHETEKLFQSILRGNLKTIKSAVAKGADVNAKFEYFIGTKWKGFETPLHLAIKTNSLEIVKFLVENRAKINEQNSNGIKPLQYAAQRNSTEICIFLIEQGANVDDQEKNIRGFTALHSAVFNSNLELVKYLVKKARANFFIKDAAGRTAIDLSVKFSPDNDIYYFFYNTVNRRYRHLNSCAIL